VSTRSPKPKPTCFHCGAVAPLMQCGAHADASPIRRCRDEQACIARWLPAEHPELADALRAALARPEVA